MMLETPAATADEAAGILVAHGAMGCEVTKIPRGSLHRGNRRTVRLHAYFNELRAETTRRIRHILKATGMLRADGELISRRIDDPGWATMWQERFEPLPLGRRFLIVPPWDLAQRTGLIQIVIRPGQAFGTGHHASTRGTLAMIEKLCRSRPPRRALDVGTGSGILAIAMRKLGVAEVTAIDIDATALENARENAELNGIGGRVRFSAAPLGSIRGRFDLISANILSSTLIEMATDLKARLGAGGHLVLAGILRRESTRVRAAYRPHLTCVAQRNDGAWTTLAFQR